MNRRIFSVFQIAILLPVLFYCGNKEEANIRQTIRPGEGWIDDNTYRVSAQGISTKTDNQAEKIESAVRNAVNNARNELFIRFNLNDPEYMDLNTNPTEVSIRNELIEIIGSGRVIERYYYNKKESCKILYEIRATGLKQKVETIK